MIYRFGTFILDLDRGSLRGSGGEIKLRRQTFRLLIVLVEKASNILSHEELLDLVWGKEHLSASSLKQAISEVRQALGDNPASPTFVETVHRRGYRFIAPVEEIDAQASSPVPDKEKLGRASGWSARSKAPFGIGFLVLLLVGGAVVLWMQDREARAAPARSSIAILGIAVISDEAGQGWTSEYLSRTLANELLSDAAMRVIPIDRTAEARRDLKIEVGECFDPEVVRKIGRVLGADFVTGGSYGPGDDSNPAVLSLIVADALTGQSRLTFHRSAPQGDFVALTQGLGSELREALNPPLPSWGELPRSTPKPISMNPEAQRLFIMGIHRLRFFDTLAAVDLLTRATRLDPDAPLLRWKLSQALLMSGNQPAAGKAADEAGARADGIPREQQLAIEAFALETHKSWDDAIRKYGVLAEFIPDNIDYPLRAIGCMVKAGKAADALEIIAALHHMPPRINTDPRIALAETKVLEPLGQLENAEISASTAITQATGIGAAIVKASALRERAWIRMKLGRQDDALEDIQFSRRLFETFGHRSGEAGALSGLAAIYLEMGHRDLARDSYLEAETIFSKIGEKSGEATVCYNLAIIQANSGDLAGSRQQFLKVLALKREINDVLGQAHVFDALAQIDEALGNLEDAENWLSEAGTLARKTGDRILEGRCIRTRADFKRKTGKIDTARSDYEKALRIFREIPNPLEEGRTLEAMASLETEEGKNGEAVHLLESAVGSFRAGSHLGDLVGVLQRLAKTRLVLGQVDMARNNLEEALKAARSLKNSKLEEGIQCDLDALPAASPTP